MQADSNLDVYFEITSTSVNFITILKVDDTKKLIVISTIELITIFLFFLHNGSLNGRSAHVLE